MIDYASELNWNFHRRQDTVEQAACVPRTTGHLMIKKLSVKNFRCFASFELTDVRRMNIIVGRNATGKTAILEAVRLAFGGTPTTAWTLNQQRAQPFYVQPNPSKEQFESLWRSLFLDLDFDNKIETTFHDSKGEFASLRIFLDAEKSIVPTTPVVQPGVQVAWAHVTSIVPVAFERRELSGKTNTLYATVTQPQPQTPYFQLHLEQGPELGVGVEFFPSSWQSNSQQVAQWFSSLAVNNREKEVVDAIRGDFEFIADLSVQAPQQIAAVYATIPRLGHKIPLSFVSSGINKMFTLMTSILTCGGGAVLIDEIEDGLHSSVLGHLWETLYRLSTKSQTQLFMTTHSWECLRAALPVIEAHDEDFSLIRLERKDAHSTPRQFAGKDLASALEEEFDVRY